MKLQNSTEISEDSKNICECDSNDHNEQQVEDGTYTFFRNKITEFFAQECVDESSDIERNIQQVQAFNEMFNTKLVVKTDDSQNRVSKNGLEMGFINELNYFQKDLEQLKANKFSWYNYPIKHLEEKQQFLQIFLTTTLELDLRIHLQINQLKQIISLEFIDLLIKQKIKEKMKDQYFEISMNIITLCVEFLFVYNLQVDLFHLDTIYPQYIYKLSPYQRIFVYQNRDNEMFIEKYMKQFNIFEFIEKCYLLYIQKPQFKMIQVSSSHQIHVYTFQIMEYLAQYGLVDKKTYTDYISMLNLAVKKLLLLEQYIDQEFESSDAIDRQTTSLINIRTYVSQICLMYSFFIYDHDLIEIYQNAQQNDKLGFKHFQKYKYFNFTYENLNDLCFSSLFYCIDSRKINDQSLISDQTLKNVMVMINILTNIEDEYLDSLQIANKFNAFEILLQKKNNKFLDKQQQILTSVKNFVDNQCVQAFELQDLKFIVHIVFEELSVPYKELDYISLFQVQQAMNECNVVSYIQNMALIYHQEFIKDQNLLNQLIKLFQMYLIDNPQNHTSFFQNFNESAAKKMYDLFGNKMISFYYRVFLNYSSALIQNQQFFDFIYQLLSELVHNKRQKVINNDKTMMKVSMQIISTIKFYLQINHLKSINHLSDNDIMIQTKVIDLIKDDLNGIIEKIIQGTIQYQEGKDIQIDNYDQLIVQILDLLCKSISLRITDYNYEVLVNNGFSYQNLQKMLVASGDNFNQRKLVISFIEILCINLTNYQINTRMKLHDEFNVKRNFDIQVQYLKSFIQELKFSLQIFEQLEQHNQDERIDTVYDYQDMNEDQKQEGYYLCKIYDSKKEQFLKYFLNQIIGNIFIIQQNIYRQDQTYQNQIQFLDIFQQIQQIFDQFFDQINSILNGELNRAKIFEHAEENSLQNHKYDNLMKRTRIRKQMNDYCISIHRLCLGILSVSSSRSHLDYKTVYYLRQKEDVDKLINTVDQIRLYTQQFQQYVVDPNATTKQVKKSVDRSFANTNFSEAQQKKGMEFQQMIINICDYYLNFKIQKINYLNKSNNMKKIINDSKQENIQLVMNLLKFIEKNINDKSKIHTNFFDKNLQILINVTFLSTQKLQRLIYNLAVMGSPMFENIWLNLRINMQIVISKVDLNKFFKQSFKRVMMNLMFQQLLCEENNFQFKNYFRTKNFYMEGIQKQNKIQQLLNMILILYQNFNWHIQNSKYELESLQSKHKKQLIVIQEQLYNNIIELCNGPCEANQLFILNFMHDNQELHNILDRHVKNINSPIYNLKLKHIDFLLCELEGNNMKVIDFVIANYQTRNLMHCISNYIKQVYKEMFDESSADIMQINKYELTHGDYEKIIYEFQSSEKFAGHPLIQSSFKLYYMICNVAQFNQQYELFLKKMKWVVSEYDRYLKKGTQKILDDILLFYTLETIIAFKFLIQMTDQIEIVRNGGQIQTYYLIKVAKSKRLSLNTQMQFLSSVNSTNIISKINQLMQHLDKFDIEMENNYDNMNKSKTLSWLQNKFDISLQIITDKLETIISILNVTIIILLLNNLEEHKTLIVLIAIVNIWLSCLGFFIWTFFKIDYETKIFMKDNKVAKKYKIFQQLKVAFMSGGSSIFFVYFVLSLLGIFASYTFFGLASLALYRLFEDLRLIVESIKAKKSQLVYTFLLMANIVYVFSAVYHFYYQNRFEINEVISLNVKQKTGETDCETLSKCFFSFMGTSLRLGQGVYEASVHAVYSPNTMEEYYIRSVLENIFFFFVNIVSIQIILGLVIDSLTNIREKNEEQWDDLQNSCMICGINRYQFERFGIDFREHIYQDHNIWSYIYFIIEIKKLNERKCNGIQLEIYRKIIKGDYSWFPFLRSISLEKFKNNYNNDYGYTELIQDSLRIEQMINSIDQQQSVNTVHVSVS